MKKDTIDITTYYSKNFELTIQLKDSHGKPTGRTKTIATDDAGKLAQFWYYNRAPVRKKTNGNLPDAKQAEKILKEQYGDK